MAMTLGNNGLSLIKHWEGLKLKAYQDVVGVWTIGYGHTKDVYEGQVITEAEAERLLLEDVEWAENAVNRYLGQANLSQNQFDALVSLVFNLGAHAIFTKQYGNGYLQGSTLYNLILLGRIDEASKRFTDFTTAGGQFIQGLYNRRVQEASLFLTKKKNLIIGSLIIGVCFITLFAITKRTKKY